MSAAAKKAWATRRKKNPKKWRKRQKWVSRHTDATCYIVKNGKVVSMKESEVHGPQTLYYSSREAEQVAKQKKH
jgi:hypothetical protein